MPNQESSSADVKRALQEARRKAQGVPDYSRRSTRMRVFFWVAAVAVIIMIMSRVRDPSFRYFIGLEDRPIANGPPLTEKEIADQSVDTLIGFVPQPEAAPASAENAADESAKPASESPTEPPELWGVSESDSPQELVTATLDAWAKILAQLNGDEQLLLYAALDALQAERRLPASEEAAWRTLVDRMGQEWKAYVTRARATLDVLPPDEQAAWNKRLDTLADKWPNFWEPLLEKWVGDEQADKELVTIAARLEKMLDVAALAAIRDDTVARPAEKAMWFRLLAKLRDTPPQELAEQSLGPTGYLALLKQPRDYRGKVVLVRGVARMAYHVEAPKNRPGIPGYYLFWVNPAGGPDSPIVAYSLELPPGFPPIAERAKGTTELHEEVAFEGYFFKRWAYNAQDGIRVAPLVLARMPGWQAPPPVDTESTPWLGIALLVSLTAVIGITLAVVMMRNSTMRNALVLSAVVLSCMSATPTVGWAQRSALPWARSPGAAAGATPRRAASARELLVNVDDSQITNIRDQEPLGANDEETLTRILFRLPKFGAFDTERLSTPLPSLDKIVAQPGDYRVKLFRLDGRATKVERVDLLPEVARRFDFDHYFRVSWRPLDADNPILICARHVPEPWLKAETLDERASTFAMFLKVSDVSGDKPQLAFAADRIAWHPEKPDPAKKISDDQVLLASLGMDYSRFADIADRDNEPLAAADTECFYQMLTAARAAKPEQLASRARPLELAPLLQRPGELHGQLTRVYGRVKRVTRIVISSPEIKDRFEIDHYYELDVILPLGDQEVRLARDAKDKSGPVLTVGFPIVCCVLEVPESLQQVGDREDLNEDMEIDAFLFRLWSYQSQFLDEYERARQAQETGENDPDKLVRRRQPSPLFIGARARLVSTEFKPTWGFSPLVGGILIGSICFLGVLVWFFQRGESASAKRLRKLRESQ